MGVRIRRAALALALAAGCAAVPAQASTVTFDAIGDNATFNYATIVDGALLQASVVYTLSNWIGTFATFHVAATNTSAGIGPAINANRLVAFGVSVVNPDLVSANVPGLSEWDAVIDAAFPGGGVVDLCNYAGPSCPSGGALGVFDGTTDEFDLTLRFASAVNATHPISFSGPFPSEWQGVGREGKSYAVSGCLSTDTGCRSGAAVEIPEPASAALAAIALLAAAGASGARRRRA